MTAKLIPKPLATILSTACLLRFIKREHPGVKDLVKRIAAELEQDGKRNFTYEHKNGNA
ncbi:MAG: hypothetical protein ACLQM8_13315 [Limisphaerales bacterium]